MGYGALAFALLSSLCTVDSCVCLYIHDHHSTKKTVHYMVLEWPEYPCTFYDMGLEPCTNWLVAKIKVGQQPKS